jgi:hypothetical protein
MTTIPNSTTTIIAIITTKTTAAATTTTPNSSITAIKSTTTLAATTPNTSTTILAIKTKATTTAKTATATASTTTALTSTAASGNYEEYERCLSTLTSLINNNKNDSEIILMGDFNADPRRSHRYSPHITNANKAKYSRLDIAPMDWTRTQKLKIVSELYTQQIDLTILSKTSRATAQTST